MLNEESPQNYQHLQKRKVSSCLAEVRAGRAGQGAGVRTNARGRTSGLRQAYTEQSTGVCLRAGALLLCQQ